MRFLFAFILVGFLPPGLSFAQQGAENDLGKLKAEVERLRAENAMLTANFNYCKELLQQLDAISNLERKIEGSWVIDAASRDGQKRPQEIGALFEFRGNRMVVRLPGRMEPIDGELRISAKFILFIPRCIVTETALDVGYGMYELKDDTLRISLKSSYVHPKEVSDKEQVLWVLKRKKS